MRNIPTKVDGVDTLPAEEFNEFASETENAILASGQILSAGTTDLLGKAMTMHAASSDFYTDSGTADSYVLTPVAAFNAPFQLTEGLRIGWLPGNTNTGASTVNVAGLGVKNIVKSAAASALDSGDLVLNEYAEARFDAGSDTFLLVQSGGVAFGGAGAAAFDIDALPDGTGITIVATDRWAVSDQSDSQIDKFVETSQLQIYMQANLAFGGTEASKAEVEAESAVAKFVPPDLIRHSPGVAKAWINFDQTGTQSIKASHNISSIVDTGVGDTRVIFTTNFSNANYLAISGQQRNKAAVTFKLNVNIATDVPNTVSQAEFRSYTGGGSVDEPDFHVSFYGDQ